MWKEERAKELKEKIRDLDVKVLCGMDGLLAVAAEPEAEILVTAIVGMIGILPTLRQSGQERILHLRIKKL